MGVISFGVWVKTAVIAISVAWLMASAIFLAGCLPESPTVTPSAGHRPDTTHTSATTRSGAPTTIAPEPPSIQVSSSTTDGISTDLVVLLSEIRSMANYYYPIWPEYEDPLFALWADGRVMIRESGGYSSPALFLEAKLTHGEIEEIRSWLEEAALDALAPSYPRPRGSGDMIIFDLPLWRLQVRDGGVKREITFEPGYPPSDRSYPAALKTLVEQLTNYRPQRAKPVVPADIDLIVEERAPVAAEGYYPLPKEYDLSQMEEILRTADNVLYQTHFQGDEAAAIAARIDAGERLYVGEGRSYWVRYRPIVDWPEP
ncbi:MAG TPA: hypothetical protein VJP78_05675 [Thermoleophilia bacterium]|nr:hypothetical protein [Thermoleophilia bacterium]